MSYRSNDKLLNFSSTIRSISTKNSSYDDTTYNESNNQYYNDGTGDFVEDTNIQSLQTTGISLLSTSDNDNISNKQQIQDLVQSVEESKSGIGYKWYESVKVTSKIINNNNIITVPNGKLFNDYDNSALLIFVNEKYVAPDKYQIINKSSFYFRYNNIIKLNDTIHIIYFDKSNLISNYDSSFFAIAKSWQYEYTNETEESLDIITLDNSISFQNPDKYSLLVYINNEFINPNNYEIPNTRELIFNNGLQLNPNESILIVQLAQILPNSEYVGYVWGEVINVEEDSNIFTISDDHSFANVNDTSALVFIDSKITKDYEILNSTQIQFSNTISAGTIITIIQLGYTTDINKIKNILDIETIKNLINIDTRSFIKEETKNKPNGVVGLNEESLIDSNLLDVDYLALKIKKIFIDNGWMPASGGTGHTHSNFDVLWRLQLFNGKLYCDGYPVGERAIEAFIDIILTEDMINNCKFTLPHDCDSNRPITLTINSVPALHDDDWYLVEHEWEELDEISWKNKLPQQLLQVGDIATVTYYKKSTDRIAPPLEPGSSGYDHYHENMRLLNALTINSLHELCVNGVPVAESAIETDIDYIITQEDIDNKYVELPEDCDGSRPIVVTLSSVRLMQSIDYKIVMNKWPEKDKISWEDLELDSLIQVDDPMCITYYRKNLIVI